MLNSHTKIKRKSLPWQELDEKIVILSPETKMSHELNESASWLWLEIETEKKFEDLVSRMVDEFEVVKEVAQADLMDIIVILEKQLLIEING